jgi:serine/threonine-protein phosphatase 6 regulatory ankyrin repeat subunit B
MLDPMIFNPNQPAEKQIQDDIRRGMMVVNALSLPFRGISWVVEKGCQTTVLHQAVCNKIGGAVKAAENAAKRNFPGTSKTIDRMNLQLRAGLERQGMSKAETSTFMNSAGILAGAAITCGVGTVAGRIIQGARGAVSASKGANNAARLGQVKAPSGNQYSGIGRKPYTGTASKPAANSNSPLLSNTHQQYHFKTESSHLFFSTTKRADGSVTAFIASLSKADSGLKSMGATNWAMNIIRNTARKEGATGLNMQWLPGNQRLFDIYKKPNQKLQYLGNSPLPAPFHSGWGADVSGIMAPTFKVLNFVKKTGLGLLAYGLLQSAVSAFSEGVQQNGLVESYNSSNGDSPMQEGGGSFGGVIGGVDNKVGIIQGLFDTADGLETKEHRFFIPTAEGKPPFPQELFQQLAREVAAGIYFHETVGFFSLHFNADARLYPLNHPALQNTAEGRVMALLDYYLKGFLNGGFFREATIHEWIASGYDDAVLKGKCVDLHDYCQTHLGSQVSYASVHEILEALELQDRMNGVCDPEESALFSDYSGFRSSFRIRAKQNSIRQCDNLFLIDGGYDVFSTIEPDAVYAEELKRFRALYGKDPIGYSRLERAFECMRVQIATMMQRLPEFQELFEQLKVINFLSYYFKTLKSAHKAPCFSSMNIDRSLCSPALFPSLPIRKVHRHDLNLDLEKMFALVAPEQIAMISRYIEREYQKGSIPDHIIAAMTPAFNQYLRSVSPFPLSDQELALKKYRQTKIEILDHIASSVKVTLEKFSPEIIAERRANADNQQQLLANGSAKLSERRTSLAELQGFIPQIQTVIAGYQQEREILSQKAALIPADQLNTAALTQAYQEIDHEIAVRQAKIVDLQQMCATEDAECKKLETGLAELTAELESYKAETSILEEVTKKPLEDSCKRLQLSLQLSVPLLQLFSEQAPEDQNRTKRVVGGCGLNLDPITVQKSSSAHSIHTHSFTSLLESPDETWIPISSPELPSGVLFKMHFNDVPASESEEFSWLPHHMQNESPQLAWEKAALFATFEEDNVQGFKDSLKRKKTKDTISPKVLKDATDPHGVSVMHYAAAAKSPEFLQEAIAAGANLHAVDSLGHTSLHYAAQHGRIENLNLLLKNAPQLLHAKAKNGATALNIAVQYNQKSCVEILLAGGSAINNRMAHGMTPLYSAVHHGFEELVLLLLQVPGIEVDCALEGGKTPLAAAVAMNQISIASALLKAGANINAQQLDSYTPLHIAAKQGSKEICQLLLNHPSREINRPLKSGLTSLHLAIEFNQLPVVRLFIECGASLSAHGWEKVTPFLLAVRQGNIDAANLMIKSAQTETVSTTNERLIDFANIQGETPLKIAIACRFHDIVELLLNGSAKRPDPEEFLVLLCRSKIDPLFIRNTIQTYSLSKEQLKQAYYTAACVGHNQAVSLFERHYGVEPFCDINGWTSVHFAARFDHVDLMRREIASVRELQQKDSKGYSLTGIAATYGSKMVLRMLLNALETRAKFHVSASLFEGHLPNERHLLAAAVESGSLDCVETIAKYLLHLNIPLDKKGRTAAHIAAQAGDVVMLELLRTRGANFNAKDKDGKTAFHYAFEYEHRKAIDYFLNKKYEWRLPNGLVGFVAGNTNGQQLEKLFEAGLSPNHAEPGEDTPLFQAIHQQRIDSLITLCRHGADLNAYSLEGHTALTLAAQVGDYACLEYLLRNNAPLQKNKAGETALHLAVKGGHEECVSLLLSQGFKPGTPNAKGTTALEIAALTRMSHITLLLNGQSVKLAQMKSAVLEALKNGHEQRFFQLIQDLPLNHPLLFELDGKQICLPLIQLAYKLSPSIFERLSHQRGIQLHTPEAKGRTVFHQMALKGAMIDFLNNKTAWNCDKNGVSVLHLFAAQDNIVALKAAIANSPHIDMEDNLGRTPLIYALIANNQAAAKCLIEAGANPNHRTRGKTTPLMIAVEQKAYLLIDILLKHGANPNAYGFDSNTSIIQFAIINDFDDGVRKLIAAGADVNKADLDGVTPLLSAAKQGSLSTMVMLHAAGASWHAKDKDGRSLVHYAAQSGKPELIDYLEAQALALDKGTKSTKESLRDNLKEEGVTPLHLAAREGDVPMLSKLLEKGSSPTAVTESHNNGLLFFATLSGNIEMVKFVSRLTQPQKDSSHLKAIEAAIFKDAIAQLKIFYPVDAGVDQTLNDQGMTALHLAAKSGALRCVHYLISRGADSSKETLHGETAFSLALKAHQLAIVHYFLENNEIMAKQTEENAKSVPYFIQLATDARLAQTLKDKKTYLHLACEAGDQEIAAMLIGRGALLDVCDSHGLTPLHRAAKLGNYALVHLLLAAGADPTWKTPDDKTLEALVPASAMAIKSLIATYQTAYLRQQSQKETPLHTAIRQGDKLHFPMLLRYCDVNKQNKNGETALHLAAYAKEGIFLRMLIENGANIEAQDKKGFTPLMSAAAKNQHINRTKWLLHLGANCHAQDINGRTLLQIVAERSDRPAKLFFDLIYNHLPLDDFEKIPSKRMYKAMEEDDLTLFFQMINLGHPVKTEKESLLQTAISVDAAQIAMVLTDWFEAKLPYTLEQLYTQGAKKLFSMHYTKQLSKVEIKSTDISKAESWIIKDDLQSAWTPGQHSIDFLMIDSKTKNSMLHLAAKSNSVKVGQFLLWYGLNPNEKNRLGNTPLHMAAHFQHKELIELLLNHGADPHAINNNGWTPLSLALQKSVEPNLVGLFTAKETHVNLSVEGRSQLLRAIEGDKTQIENNLIVLGAKLSLSEAYKVNRKDLFLSSYKERITISDEKSENLAKLDFASVDFLIQQKSLQKLLESDIAIDFAMCSSENSNNLLHLAAKYDCREIAEFLLWFGLDANVSNKLGNTPLHMAAHFSHMEIVKSLLEGGVDLQSQNNQGFTPLTLALQKPLELAVARPIAELFTQKGAKINPSFNGKTQVEIARSKQKGIIVQNLLQLET